MRRVTCNLACCFLSARERADSPLPLMVLLAPIETPPGYCDAVAGGVVAGCALPYAFVGGLLATAPAGTTSPSLTRIRWLMQVPWFERRNLERWNVSFLPLS